MKKYTIGEIARQAGLQTSAIRFYERRGLLPAPERVNGIRYYDASVVDKLAVIQLAQGVGFTISEIHTLLHDFPADAPPAQRWETLAPKKLDELDALINRALQMRSRLQQTLACQCETLEQCGVVTQDVNEEIC